MAKKIDFSSVSFTVDQASVSPSFGPSDYDMAYQNYIASEYARAMYEKRYREMTVAAFEELSELMIKTREMIFEANLKKIRARRELNNHEIVKSCDEAVAIGTSVGEVYEKGMAVLENTLESVERTLSQLPIGNGVTFHKHDTESLKATAELLLKKLEEHWSGLESIHETWKKFAEIVKDKFQDDILLHKTRCDELIKKINEVMVKLSAVKAAKTARECLNL